VSHTHRLSDEQRAQRRREDREFAQQAVQALRSSDGFQAWLRARRSFRSYSWANQCLLAMQAPDATFVAGFRAWLKLGYVVRRGERALKLWVPMKPSAKRLAEWQAAGGDPATKPQTWFRLGAVFSYEQVDPLPPPATPVALQAPIAPIEGDTLAHALEPLCALAHQIGSTVTFSPDTRGDGHYNLASKAIVIADTLTINGQVATLAHELAHALVRADRRPEDPQLDYAAEELVAESVSYVVCAGALGLDTAANSVPYLAIWVEKSPIETIEHTAALIDRLAKHIEDAVLPEVSADDHAVDVEAVAA
jgi:antirestriction protein ArdC